MVSKVSTNVDKETRIYLTAVQTVSLVLIAYFTVITVGKEIPEALGLVILVAAFFAFVITSRELIKLIKS